MRFYLKITELYDSHYITCVYRKGSEVQPKLLCLDPSAFLDNAMKRGKAAVLFSATLSPAGYFIDVLGGLSLIHIFMVGYLFLGVAFGVLLQKNGYGVFWAILMSAVIYAGSMQFLAINFLTPGVGVLSIIFMTLMVNIRHIFYGLSMLELSLIHI